MSGEKIKGAERGMAFMREIFVPLIENNASFQDIIVAKLVVIERTCFKKRDVERIYNELVNELRSQVETTSNSCSSLSYEFHVQENPTIVSFVKHNDEGQDYRLPFSNAIIEIKLEERIEDPIDPQVRIRGDIRIDDENVKFDWSSARFSSNQLFNEDLHNAYCSKVQCTSLDGLRAFAKVNSNPEIKQVSRVYGWNDKDEYLTPHLVIDKVGIRENKLKEIRFEEAFQAKNLCFENIQDEDKYNDLLGFFVENFSALHEPTLISFTLGHVFLAPVHAMFKHLPKVILWVHGRTGDGKSFIQQIPQNLFGDFPPAVDDRKISWTSSIKYIALQCAYLKDVATIIDDYKDSNISKMERNQVSAFLANIFDSTGRGTLRKDRSINTQAVVRCLPMVNGEDLPPAEAATLARITIVKYPTRPRNFIAGKKLLNRLAELKGILPRYIHWFLNQDIVEFDAYFEDLKDQLFNHIQGAQNDIRIATTTAEYGLGFHLMTNFLVHRKVWSEEVALEKEQAFLDILKNHVVQMSLIASEEQGSNKFLRILKSLLSSGEVTIGGVRMCSILDVKPGRQIGVTKEGNKHFGTIYIDPELALNSVEAFLRQGGAQGIGFTKQALGEQLKGDDFFSRDCEVGNTVRVRLKDTNNYYWPLKRECLGILPEAESFRTETESPHINF